MSVDTKRENFHVNRVEVDKLSDFLTAQTYRPEITEALAKIKSFGNWKHLNELCAEPIRQGVSPVYAEKGYPCLKSKHTRNLIVDKTNYDFVTEEFSVDKAHLKVKNEDVLITRSGAGTIGRASIYFGHECPLTNEHLFKVRCTESDPAFVAAYLLSYYGERILEYGISGSTGQLNLSNTHIKWLPIIEPESLAQIYIGNKVRQSDLLGRWAQSLESIANLTLDDLLDKYDVEPKKFSNTSQFELENRLDPRPYRNHYKSMVNEIKNHNYSEVGDIAKLSSGDPVPSELFGQEGTPLIRIRNIGKNDFVDLDAWLPNDYVKNKQGYNAKVGDIVLGMDGIFRAQFFIDYDLPARINQRVAIFRCHDIEPELLCFWLNRIEGQNQLNQWAVKTTVEHTSLDYISRIVIPRFDRTEESTLAKTLNTKRRATYLSKRCSDSAKLIIEALIEDKITESQIIDAQQALEEGDNSKDKAILKKLTDKGYLVEGGKPLFNDLDKLYELLDDAQNAIDGDSSENEEVLI
jgi:type I restriction enzyme S subunit